MRERTLWLIFGEPCWLQNVTVIAARPAVQSVHRGDVFHFSLRFLPV